MPASKSNFIHVRVTDPERQSVLAAAEAAGCPSVSEWMRAVMAAGVLGSREAGSVPAAIVIDRRATAEIYKELLREGRNLNQTSRALNRTRRLLVAALRRPGTAEDALRSAQAALEEAQGSYEEACARWDGLVGQVNELLAGDIVREGGL